MRVLRVLFLASLLVSLASVRARSGAIRIALLNDTQVSTDTILLSSLLPPSVPESLRSATEKIALGAAPRNGATRLFTRDALSAAIEAAGLSPSDFSIPDVVSIHRNARLLTREEVFAALEAALAKNSFAGLSSLRRDDISMAADVFVPPGDARLEVTQISFDQFLGRARIRIWPRSAPGVLPFYVTARVPSASMLSASSGRRLSVSNVGPAHGDAAYAPFLVQAGRFARLHLHSANSDMLLQVIPLQRGRLGDLIRVRLPGTGRALQARVAGLAYLDATF
jgi:hypothetical protein